MPIIKVAAVQQASVYLNLEATLEKSCTLIREAASHGAHLVAFPEAFLPGYPYWVWLEAPVNSLDRFVKLYQNSVSVPGPAIAKICETAAECSVVVVIGVNEVDPVTTGTIYNTNVIINHTGKVLGKHRKLVPTYAEKLVWGNGDGSGYQVYETQCGRVGTLPCGENTNTLARYALLALGEQVHIANFPAFPFTNWYQETEAIRIRCQAHAFEGKVFVIAACGAMDEQTLRAVARNEEQEAMLRGKNYALSGVFGPDGQAIGELLIDEPGIVYADIDLDKLLAPKLMHDITGHYNQFAVLSLNLNRARQEPIHDHTLEFQSGLQNPKSCSNTGIWFT